MTEYEEIIIRWKPRIKWAADKFEKMEAKNVLYQIYCDSHLYGRDVLAYIGKTDRSFGQRMDEHFKSFFQYANNVNYSVGEIMQYTGKLEIPESILIANHKPFFNKEYIHDLPLEAKKQKIIVINEGEFGMLKSCCTNYWWCEKK
ncbi:MAG TPA: hypothetical protein PK198_04335 [Saprospiraceae bacterium]|nr:hypothetical protein [Saprospiraceae bacterium]HRK82632.1 hypothetical protein [Saprospiraceae bacterium]